MFEGVIVGCIRLSCLVVVDPFVNLFLELHDTLMSEFKERTSSDAFTLEPVPTLERNGLGGSKIIHLHPLPEVNADFETGVDVYSFLVNEQLQDNHYVLRLNFDNHSFEYRIKKTVYEGGDGVYETVYKGTFSKETTGSARKSKTKGRKNVSAPEDISKVRVQNCSLAFNQFSCKGETRDGVLCLQGRNERLLLCI